MEATSSNFTLAEFCDQLRENKITINRSYQRSDKVWPPAARSFLIDTILSGFPVPKIILWQSTDLRTRKTHKQIVDGQQRSQAILDFFEDKFRISGTSAYKNSRFSTLDAELQKKFVDYSISADVLTGATEEDVRQVFRRMNSYTVPLNKQELRHATFQGEFKFFILEQSQKYATALISIGLFTNKQLARMADAELISELVLSLLNGIETASQAKLTQLYREYDKTFPRDREVVSWLDTAFGFILDELKELHNTPLMQKKFLFYSLFLAVAHITCNVPALSDYFSRAPMAPIDQVRTNLSLLSEVTGTDSQEDLSFADFTKAAQEATNTKGNRAIRFNWLCRALTNEF